MLNYKKPSFWISLLGVIAIIFVAVCLLTSPAEDEEKSPAADAPAAGETTEPAAEAEIFSPDMTEDEIVAAVQKGIDDLKARESYYVFGESIQESNSGNYATFTTTSEIRRHGNNSMNLYRDNGSDSIVNSHLYFEGTIADHYGDAWVLQDYGENYENEPNYWLDNFFSEDLEISFTDGMGIQSGNTVAFEGTWKDLWSADKQSTGYFFFTFNSDGSLASMRREYSEVMERTEETRYVNTYTVMAEHADTTYAKIQEQAAQAIPAEELERVRREAQQVSEIPSNKTNYDKDFMLGSGQMGWQMAKGEWFFKFGLEDVSETGGTIVIEYNGPYGNNTVSGGTVTSGTEYFIEELVDDTWVTVEPTAASFTPIQEKSLPTGARQTISWENNYGALPGGFYRIGNYYTFTSGTGETDTQVCYAKFRLYDPNHEKLLSQAKAAIEALANRENYHIYNFDWMTEHDYEYYLSNEVWKHGADYLEVTKYPLREDMSQMSSVRGSLWRDGKYYGLTWEGEPAYSAVTEWWASVDGYMDESNFDMWSWDYEWYDANVEVVYQEGNTIHIVEKYDFDNKYECTEIVLTFDDDGNLIGMANYYLPARNSAQKDKVVSKELVVFNNTAAEIAGMIDSQDISEPMPFSYEEDVKNNPNAQTSGFKNTAAKPITTAAEAVALADKESILPQLMEFESGYCQTQTYYDEKAGIWKVHMYWWQHDTAQTVYMDDQGITRMIVTIE